jgi:hypothetical protein
MPPRWTHSPILKPSSSAPGSIEGLVREGLVREGLVREGLAIAYFPISRRSASQCGRPLARIRLAAVSTS